MEFWTLILVLTTVVMFSLPLLPALVELAWPTDNTPLKVVRDYDGNVRHFAHGFRRYIDTHFAQMLEQDKPTEGQLSDGSYFQIVGEKGIPMPEDNESTQKLILSRHKLALPDGLFFKSEVFSAHSIVSGRFDNFRALMSNGDIRLKENSTVLRWVHSETTLYAEPGCKLFGRASAERSIMLSEGCVFERLHSARIAFGRVPAGRTGHVTPAAGLITIEKPENVQNHFGRRWVVKGALDILKGRFFDGDLIATGPIHIGKGCHIKGSMKSNGDFEIKDNTIIEGSVVSTGDLYIGPGCRITGPVIAEKMIYIGTDTVIGTEAVPTTVTAPEIVVEPGVAVFGTVWASREGWVESTGIFPARASA